MKQNPLTSSRRKFLAVAPAAAAAPLLSACGGDDVASAPVTDAALAAQMSAKLTAQLGDAATVDAMLPALADAGFAWALPTIPAAQVGAIVAYSFGNRPNAASGNTSSTGGNQSALPDPGPVNEALADAVYRIRQLKPVKVYAQWEIARFLVSKYGMGTDVLTSIEPVIASDGSIVYLSTAGVAAAAVQRAGGAAAMGNVAVVGHRDHAKRCIQTSQQAGMQAAAVAEVALPTVYDPQSGQPWTRNRSLYLVHDMYAQLLGRAAAATMQAFPKG
ncbi:hypothetical protein DN523_02165 [Burkholderia multivorans]|uniref:hypothetical protein n=1 Tax=Burkholderia multivorans TaxID=87883 RepID=UPI000DAE67FD|nr:hypothetical protein [Burkholderia multivorans]RAA24803.1 hypothetical protein DN470_15890 [Burkholderia multivorans]RAA32889.1 hypothetical protein DN471_02810 [Burkholderia multivorans]RAA33242.1 hypothetical protein DN465_18360 [Burkholderia multivorans]RAA48095.1 hypothetical protein DN500_07795 [Burkholderia multivorans]RAA50587.1 hypothetical protein DN472_02240 [Burkholderia multivorans]